MLTCGAFFTFCAFDCAIPHHKGGKRDTRHGVFLPSNPEKERRNTKKFYEKEPLAHKLSPILLIFMDNIQQIVH